MFNIQLKKTTISFMLIFSIGIIHAQSKKIPRVTFNGQGFSVFNSKEIIKPKLRLGKRLVKTIKETYNLGKHAKTNGAWIQYYSDSSKQSPALTFELHNDLLDGEMNVFYMDGTRKACYHFCEGHLTGSRKEWYPNGQLKDSMEYYLDTIYLNHNTVSAKITKLKQRQKDTLPVRCLRIKHLHSSLYYPNGQLYLNETYTPEGLSKGDWLVYYQNGQLKSSTHYVILKDGSNQKQDIVSGRMATYYENGQIRYEAIHKNDTIVEDYYCEYYENGQKKQSGSLYKGRKNKQWKKWYPNGQLHSIGEYTTYSTKGNVCYSSKIGFWTYYYDNGQVMCSGKYELAYNGKSSIPDFDEPSLFTINLTCGAISDKWEAFDEDGKPITIYQLIEAGLIKDRETWTINLYYPNDIYYTHSKHYVSPWFFLQ